MAVTRNEGSIQEMRLGVDIMGLLFHRRGSDIQITEDVVIAVASTEYCGHENMALLLDRRGADVQITEGVVKAAAGNRSEGREIMALLFDQRGSEVQITEEVVKAAVGNRGKGREIMALLFDQRGSEVRITEEVVKLAAGNEWSGEMMELLFDRLGSNVQITEEVAIAAARNEWCGPEVMAVLLDRRGADVQITEDVVKAAAGNGRRGPGAMTLLFDRLRSEVQITVDVIKAAARNKRSGERVMKLLLDRRASDVQITEEVVKLAAGNEWSGPEVMKLLLDRPGSDVYKTEDVVIAAARNERCGDKVMALLFYRRRVDVRITEAVVRAAAGNRRSGREVMARLLLYQPTADVHNTEEVVIAPAEYDWIGNEAITVLCHRREATRQPPKIMESFSRFNRLPTEIREMIWTLSFSQRYIPGDWCLSKYNVAPPRPPALLVNHEAHAVALRHYKSREYLAPDYVGREYLFHIDFAVDAIDAEYFNLRSHLRYGDESEHFADFLADISKARSIVMSTNMMPWGRCPIFNGTYCRGLLANLTEVIILVDSCFVLPGDVGRRDPVNEIQKYKRRMDVLRCIKTDAERCFLEPCVICDSYCKQSCGKTHTKRVPEITFAKLAVTSSDHEPFKLVPFKVLDEAALAQLWGQGDTDANDKNGETALQKTAARGDEAVIGSS